MTTPSSEPDETDDTELPDQTDGADDADSGAGCPEPQLTADDLTATPREDYSAEVLAILATQEPIATDAAYERALRDHQALVTLEPRLSTFWTPPSPAVGNEVSVEISSDRATFEADAACINQEWGASVSDVLEVGQSRFAFIRLDGLFNLDLLAAAYRQIPSVLQANGTVPTPPPVVTDDEAFARGVTRAGDVYSYSFSITKLDCSIQLTIDVDGAGTASISSWTAEPQVAACQRPEP
jgi:hypothetical protein